ncbi:apoptosis regulator R1-like [Mya arenaria]|uniref:apoptosis regulator R1-like n=1 Tax=Mya arenaria TaxID=6604 RepID=UPI0022DFE49C|nr:apoptosis regulator R1-like [Mya arenaria]
MEVPNVAITTSLLITDYINFHLKKNGFKPTTEPLWPLLHCGECSSKLDVNIITSCPRCKKMKYWEEKDTTEDCGLVNESKHLRQMCEEFIERYDSAEPGVDLQSDVNRVNREDSELSMAVYWDILDNVIEKGSEINWFRIVAIVAFAGGLAAHCVRINRPNSVAFIREWTCAYFNMKIDDWIKENNGWVGLVDYHDNRADRNVSRDAFKAIAAMFAYGIGAIVFKNIFFTN